VELSGDGHGNRDGLPDLHYDADGSRGDADSVLRDRRCQPRLSILWSATSCAIPSPGRPDRLV